MISDVLSDAVDDIEQYLVDEPDYVYAEEIRTLCFVMDKMRALLDLPSSTPDDFFAAREAEFRRLTAAAKVLYDGSASLVSRSNEVLTKP